MKNLLALLKIKAKPHAGLMGGEWTAFLWRVLSISVMYFLCIDFVFAASGKAGDATASFTLFDAGAPLGFIKNFDDTGAKMQTSLIDQVRPTFRILATIEIAWAAVLWTFEKDNLSAFAAELIQKIMYIGFFYELLDHGPDYVAQIINSMNQAGTTASGVAAPTVDTVIANGLAVVNMMWKDTFKTVADVVRNFILIGLMAFASIIVGLAYVIAAAQLLCLHIEQVIVLAAGAVFLGFGASKWTNEYVTKYLTYALTVGMRTMVILVILGLMGTMTDSLSTEFNAEKFKLIAILKLITVSVVMALLVVKAPEMATALMTGGIGMSAGNALSAAKGVVGTAQAVGKGVEAAKSGAKSAVSAAGRVGSLGKSGVQAAKAGGASGGGALAKGLGMAGKQLGREAVKGAIGATSKSGSALERATNKLKEKAGSGGTGGGGKGGSNT